MLQIAEPAILTLNHDGHGGNEQTLNLAPDEIIISVEAHWGKKDKHTQVFYICLTPSTGKTLAGGTQTDIQMLNPSSRLSVFTMYYFLNYTCMCVTFVFASD